MSYNKGSLVTSKYYIAKSKEEVGANSTYYNDYLKGIENHGGEIIIIEISNDTALLSDDEDFENLDDFNVELKFSLKSK